MMAALQTSFDSKAVVHSAHPHYGEEVPLVGQKGSGTIFFSNCNLRCVFCQNSPISHEGSGVAIEDEDLAGMMIHLQIDGNGAARRGLVIRHLVMPDRVAGTKEFVEWVAASLPKFTYVNIMHQYHVDYKAFEYLEICRGITSAECLEAREWAETCGLTNLDPRSLKVRDFYRAQGGSSHSIN